MHLVREGKTRWSEKSIGAAELVGRFHSLFPEAKFICLVTVIRHGHLRFAGIQDALRDTERTEGADGKMPTAMRTDPRAALLVKLLIPAPPEQAIAASPDE